MGYSSLRDYDGFTDVPEDEAYQLSSLRAEAAGGNSFLNSVKMSRLGNEMSLLADEESKLRTSDSPTDRQAAQLLRSRIRSLRDESRTFATAPQDYETVQREGLSALPGYIAGQLGQAVGSSIDQMATGSAMGLASGIAGLIPHPAAQAVAWGLRGAAPLEMYRQNKNLLTGEAYNEIADDPVAMQRSAQDIRDEVSKHGYRAAVLDTLPQLLPVGQIGGVAGKALGRIPTSAKLLGEAVGEGLTETGQQYSQQRAHSQLNPERDTSGDMSELINSGLGGAIGGGGMGAVGHYGEKMWARGRTEGDGKNGDVIDLNAPDEKPKTILEELNGGRSRFTERESKADLLRAINGETDDPSLEGMANSVATRKETLINLLGTIRGKEAKEHLAKVSQLDVSTPDAAIQNLDNDALDEARNFVAARLHLVQDTTTKNNAERGKRDKNWDTGAELDAAAKASTVDSSVFKFELDPSHFLAPTEEKVTGTTINERAAANKARLEQAQNKAKLFNTRAELVANKLWNAYTDEHGFDFDADLPGPSGEPLSFQKVRQGDPQAVGLIRNLAQELTAAATVQKPTPAEDRRAQRLAEQLVQAVGTKSLDVLSDINRITGSTMALKGIVSAASSYLGATNSSALKVQHETRDAAAVDLTKLIPAEVEMRLAKDHGIDLSSNKDRNDLLDLMEDVVDGRTSVPRIKLNKLFSKPVVDAMEEYLGKMIMPRLEGVKDDLIDENDSYGSKTQATDTEGTHDTEQSVADPHDLTSDEEVSDFDKHQMEKSLDRVAPDSLVFHVSGDKRGSMVKFSDAWKENDDGRLPKLIHPGDGRTLEHVQKLVAKATARLGPEQRDRYVMGNPASKDPMEAAGATNAKKILDDSGVPDDQRLKLMMRYMEQEGKAEVPGEVAHAISNLSVAERASAYISSVLGKRGSLSPSGEKLSVEQNAGLNPTRGDLDAVLSVAKKSSRYSELAAIPDLGARMAAMVPIVKSAVETARESLARNVPGYQEFVAKNPSADLKDYVNDFFSQRYAVVAEQPTDRDYLQMNLAEFNDMAKKGASNLNSAWVTAGDDEAEQNKVKAGMNIIHFKSRHSNTGEVAIPANKLVKWVRDQENAHTDDKRANDTGSGSQNAQHESYLDALKQGITALHMGGLTEGLPWIVNAQGEREEFSPAGETVGKEMSYRTAGKTEVEDGWRRTGLGDLPPSLDVGGISYADLKRKQKGAAYHRRMEQEAEAEKPGAEATKLLKEIDADEAKSAELTREPVDVQGADMVADADAIANGSKTRDAEREHIRRMSSVLNAATGHLPKALTVGAAVNKAGAIAQNLWRDYASDREAGLARIFGYARSIERAAHSDDYAATKRFKELWREFHSAEAESDEANYARKLIEAGAASGISPQAVGGLHYAAPLAAMLTPRNLAGAHPGDKATFEKLRSQVAQTIVEMARPPKSTADGKALLDMGQVRKLVNYLSGYADSQKKADFVPADGMGRFLVGLAAEGRKVGTKETREIAKAEAANTAKTPEKHTPSSPIQAPGSTKTDSVGVGSQNTLQAAVARHQEYLKNPPEDYTTERAAAIGTWAAKQLERVRERAKTDQSDELQDMIDDLSRLVKTAGEVTAADRELEAKLGPQGSVKRNAETYSGKLADKPIFTDFAEASKEDQALVEKLNGLIRKATTVRRRAVVPLNKNAGADRAGLIASRAGKKLVWVENLGTAGATHPLIPGVIFLDPGSDRSVQVLAAHELAHSLKHDDPAAYDRLADELGHYVDEKAWQEFSKRLDDLHDADGIPRLSEEGKIEEMVANLLSDYAYRSRETESRAEYEARGGNFTGYGGYLREGAQGKVDAALEKFLAAHGQSSKTFRNAEATAAQQAEADAANQFAKLATMAPPKHIEVTSAIKYFERNVSSQVKLILQDVFPDMKGGADFDTLTNIARISTANARSIMRLTYHESVHAFFNTILKDKGMEKARDMLLKAMSEPKVYERLKELLKGETAALADMERDPEERVAYAFQFWKLGLLDIDHAPKTFFEKVQALMRRVFGAVRDSEKALAIFTAFDQGQLKETSAAGRAIEKIMGQGEWYKQQLAKYDKQAQALYTEVMANHLNFRNSESTTAKLLGRMWYTNPAYGADTEQVDGQEGVINRTKFKRDYYSNRVRVALKPLQGANLKRDLETLAEALNSHTEPTTAILRKAKKDLHAILTEYRDYARQAGLDIGEQLGADGKYWPRVYEIEKLINGKESFVNMLLTRHGKLMTTIKAGAIQAGESNIATERDVAEMIHQSLIDRLGVQDHKLKALREDGVLSPFFASHEKRTLEWLEDDDVAPYLSKDVIGTMTQYISQGVRAAEYTRTFGEDGRNLRDMLAKKGDVKFVSKEGEVVKYEEDGPIRSELVAAAEEKEVPEAKREEWVERRMEDLKRASGAMEGSLGKDISATARQLQAGAMTYQILRLLPFMIFSSMLDANGIRVAGGEWEDMFNAYKRGFTGLWRNWKDLFLGNPFGMRDPDEMEKAALAAGVINSDMENEEMGEVHSSEYSSGLTRHINHVFFKAIGITQWDRDMRIVATDAARKAIVRDYNNAVPEHSARWLRELGLKKDQIFIKDGQLVVSAAELMKMKNIKDVAVAQKLLEPTHFAINRWVNRAIVSPNAGLRPTRASDPHFAMFYQFKSFTYAFQETTMRYALHEAEHGNFTAAARLLHGVPIMIASDMMKAMVTGGGSMPGYMANWTLVDWISHGINRSGIGGTSSFITDMLGGNVAGTLAGPTVDHIVGTGKDILTGEVGHAIKQSLPAVKQLASG